MNIHVFAKTLRNLRNRAQIDLNSHLGREFIPHHAGVLYIETSSICNLKCRFCAYEKKESPRVNMPDELFSDCVEQAVGMGLVRYHLTPCTGDVFMDKGLFGKLALLDAHARVESYDFFTNFTIPSEDEIERLLLLKKLESMKISVYGHDLQSFVDITKSTEKVYRRLLSNLEALLPRLPRVRFGLSIGLRTTGDGRVHGPSELQQLLGRFEAAGVRVGMKRVFNNWGGMITSADVEGLDIEVTDTRSTYKKGACTLLFTGVQVMATGIVNGCACRDVNATLKIGDLNQDPLSEILSLGNPAYRQLVQEQEAGQFRPICRSCDYYRSIYRTTRADRKLGRSPHTLPEFLESTRGG
jgi:hypothetical protein